MSTKRGRLSCAVGIQVETWCTCVDRGNNDNGTFPSVGIGKAGSSRVCMGEHHKMGSSPDNSGEEMQYKCPGAGLSVADAKQPIRHSLHIRPLSTAIPEPVTARCPMSATAWGLGESDE